MPKSTFFNIDEEKRNRIMNAAFDEFANELYENASISKIVKEAKIPKGSFYQYFEDKFDLYKYILDEVAEVKMGYLQPVLDNLGDKGFIETIEELYFAAFKMIDDKPEYYAIGRNFMATADTDMKSRVMKAFAGQGEDYFALVLSKTLANEKLDPNVDQGMLVNMINTMHIGISEKVWLGREYGDLNLNVYMSEVRKMLYIIENGMYKEEK